MKLKEICNEDIELEIWDAQVDIRCPIYLYGEHNYQNNDDERNFYLMENWMNELEVSYYHGDSCCVDVYSEMEKNWATILEKAKDRYILSDDDESIAAYTEDVFTCLAQGYYGFANDFVKFMGL